MIAPNTKDMYAINETIPAKKPFSLYLLKNIKPTEINKKMIPAKEIYIFSKDSDMLVTSYFIYQQYIIAYKPMVQNKNYKNFMTK